MAEAERSPEGPVVRRQRWPGVSMRLWLACAVCAALPPYRLARLRTALLRLAGLRIGTGSVVAGRVWIAGGATPTDNLVVGRGCFVNDGVTFDTVGRIEIGDHVDIAHGVAFITSSHELGDGDHRAGRSFAAPVTIGSGCWIGARATLLPGVAVGSRSVVGAGSVVTRSVPADTLVGGSPARPLRSLVPLVRSDP